MVRLPGSVLVALSLLVATLGWHAKPPAVVLAVSMPPVLGPLDDAAVARAISDLGARPVPLELRDRGGLFLRRGWRVPDHGVHARHLGDTPGAAGCARRYEVVRGGRGADRSRAGVLRVVASPSAPTVGASRSHSSAVLRV